MTIMVLLRLDEMRMKASDDNKTLWIQGENNVLLQMRAVSK